jgi:hypothetical protein
MRSFVVIDNKDLVTVFIGLLEKGEMAGEIDLPHAKAKAMP